MKSLQTVFFLGCLFLLNVSAAGENKTSTNPDTTLHIRDFKHSINSCPVAPAFGIYSVNYEYLFKPHHGLVVRVDYESIPKRFDHGSVPDIYPGADIMASGIGYILNYRYHVSGNMNSLYIGAYGRYRYFKGNGTVESTEFNFSVPEWTLGVNAGKRWVFESGFNISFGFGWGMSRENWNAEPSSTKVDEMIEAFKSKYDFFTPFYGEGSIGFAF